MVKEKVFQGKKAYQCNDCKLLYEDKKWAEKCEAWCLANHACNLEITKHRIKTTK